MALTVYLPERFTLTGNPIKVSITDFSPTPGITICLEIYWIDGTNETLIATESIKVIAQGHTFDISEYLKLKKEGQFSYYNSGILNNTNLVDSWAVRAYELINNDGIKHNYTDLSELRYAIQGGLSSDLIKQYKYVGIDFTNEFSTYNETTNSARFMTWMQSDYKITNRNAEERLYFINRYNFTKITVRLHFTDGTSVKEEVLTANLLFNRIYELNTSFNKLGLASFEIAHSKTITKYSVAVKYITEEFTYFLDEKHYNKQVQFIFKNSFGCYDTLELKGVEEQDNEFDFDILQGIERFRTNTISEEIHKINTGWISNLFKDCKKGSKYFKELFLSDEVYVVDENNNVVKIIITSKKQKRVFKDGEYLYSFDIEYLTAEQEYFYSEINPYELPNCFMITDDLGNPVPFEISEGCFKITNP